MGLFDSIGSALGIGSASTSRGSTTFGSTKTTQKQFSQEAIDKTIYDILSSDQGLSALANAENASGGYGSSSKTLLAQDLIAKVAGTIAQITAPEVTTESGQKVDKNTTANAKTVICTHLAEQGYLDLRLYLKGTYHTLMLPEATKRGYLFWAEPVVSLMKKYPFLCSLIAPTVRARYEFIVNGRASFLGCATVYIGQPICHLIGMILSTKESYGRQPA